MARHQRKRPVPHPSESRESSELPRKPLQAVLEAAALNRRQRELTHRPETKAVDSITEWASLGIALIDNGDTRNARRAFTQILKLSMQVHAVNDHEGALEHAAAGMLEQSPGAARMADELTAEGIAIQARDLIDWIARHRLTPWAVQTERKKLHELFAKHESVIMGSTVANRIGRQRTKTLERLHAEWSKTRSAA